MGIDLGCSAPVIVATGCGTLTVTSAHDSYVWSTGEAGPQASSIVVSPLRDTCYWVRTTGPGACDEASMVLIRGGCVFLNGIEDDSTSAWSITLAGQRAAGPRR
jgi:hypothetical protein